MSKKCIGCGMVNITDMDYCERCFKLKNYNIYQSSPKTNKEYTEIYNKINKTKDLVIWVCSVFNLDLLKNMNDIIKNDIILVINKRDILPKSVKNFKIINYLNKMGIKYLDIEIISSINNYHLDELYNKINKYKKSNNVYIVGYTNSGKSTLVNKLIKNYSEKQQNIIASIYPSTTLDEIPIQMNDELTIIDTPGLLSEGSIINTVSIDKLKLINISKEIHPRTYQLNRPVSFIIDDLIRIDYLSSFENSMTIYLSNNIKIIKCGLDNQRLKELSSKNFILSNNKDIVVEDLCFIKMVKSCDIRIYSSEIVNVFMRDNLI